MTRYEQGFMKKCAEYGVDGTALLKRAMVTGDYAAGLIANFAPAAIGGAAGAGIGAAVDKKKRWRGALAGALGGAGLGFLGGRANMARVARSTGDTADRINRMGQNIMNNEVGNYDMAINPWKAALLLHGLLPKSTKGLYTITPKPPVRGPFGTTTYHLMVPESD